MMVPQSTIPTSSCPLLPSIKTGRVVAFRERPMISRRRISAATRRKPFFPSIPSNVTAGTLWVLVILYFDAGRLESTTTTTTVPSFRPLCAHFNACSGISLSFPYVAGFFGIASWVCSSQVLADAGAYVEEFLLPSAFRESGATAFLICMNV